MTAEREYSSQTPGVTLVVSALVCGGAERVVKNMADCWVAHGRRVTLITLFSRDLDFFQVDDRVERVDLGLCRNALSSWRLAVGGVTRLLRLRGAIKEAGHPLVISFLTRTNVLTLLATRLLPIHVVVCEHTDPRQKPMGGLLELLRRRLYPGAAAVTVLTSNVKEEWADRFLDPEKVVVMANPIEEPGQTDDTAPIALPSRYVVTMGRLILDKGHKILINAFASIADRFPDVSLVILGEGPEREALQAVVEETRLNHRVLMPGLVRRTEPALRGADCFVLSSRREGFPLALAEAMNNGVASISFDCPSGPADIIRNGVDGILVPPGDTDALAQAIADLLENPGKRMTLGKNAARGIKERFSVETIMGRWDALLEHCMESERSCVF